MDTNKGNIAMETIICHEDQYWFWDEYHENQEGPFNTLVECKEALDEYSRAIDRELGIPDIY